MVQEKYMHEKLFYKKDLTSCQKYGKLILPQMGSIFLRVFLNAVKGS